MTDNTKLQSRDNSALIRKITMSGDLSILTEQERFNYAMALCEHYNLDPLTRPFDFIANKKEGTIKIYANESCTDQLRKNHKATAEIIKTEIIEECFCVWARISTPDDRTTDELGSTSLRGSAEEKANAMKKAVTQALRRGTLAHCGLSAIDASEVPDIPGAEILAIPKALQGWQCSQETAQRIVSAAEVLKAQGHQEAGLRGVFKEAFPAVKSTRDLEDADAIKLAEAYEAMVQEVR